LAFLLWLDPTSGGRLPPTSMFYAPKRGVASIYVLGTSDPDKRNPAYKRIVEALLRRVAKVKPDQIRVEHSSLSRKIVDIPFSIYPGLRMPKDLLPVAGFADILADQSALYGEAEQDDEFKLIFQALYGAEHMLADEEKALQDLIAEWDKLSESSDEPFAERISPFGDLYRVNLRPAKELGIKPESIFKAVKRSAFSASEGLDTRKEKLKALLRTAGFNTEDIPDKPLRHSQSYKQQNNPAYRLVKAEEISGLLD